MNQEQINSIVRSVLKIAGSIALALGATKASSIINSEDCIGLVVLLVGLWESHQSHADTLLKAIKEFSQGPAPLPPVPVETMLANASAQLKSPISINQGGGSPATPKSFGAEPTAAPAHFSDTGEAPVGPAGGAPAGTRETRVLPAQDAAPNVTLVSFDTVPAAAPQKLVGAEIDVPALQPTTIAPPPTT